MRLEINSKYILRFIINTHELVYTATILDDDGVFISFVDKYGKKYQFNKSTLMNVEEVRE